MPGPHPLSVRWLSRAVQSVVFQFSETVTLNVVGRHEQSIWKLDRIARLPTRACQYKFASSRTTALLGYISDRSLHSYICYWHRRECSCHFGRVTWKNSENVCELFLDQLVRGRYTRHHSLHANRLGGYLLTRCLVFRRSYV